MTTTATTYRFRFVPDRLTIAGSSAWIAYDRETGEPICRVVTDTPGRGDAVWVAHSLDLRPVPTSANDAWRRPHTVAVTGWTRQHAAEQFPR